MPSSLARLWHTYLIERDGPSCWYCGDQIDGDGTLEHLIPATPACAGCRLSTAWNLVRAHYACNWLAGSNRLARKFALRDYLRAHGGQRALCNVRARFQATDPCTHEPNTRQRRMEAQKRKRAAVKAWKRERKPPLRAPLIELAPGLAAWCD